MATNAVTYDAFLSELKQMLYEHKHGDITRNSDTVIDKLTSDDITEHFKPSQPNRHDKQ
jgi:hypothetical protein